MKFAMLNSCSSTAHTFCFSVTVSYNDGWGKQSWGCINLSKHRDKREPREGAGSLCLELLAIRAV